MKKWEDLERELLKNKEVKKEFDKLAPRYAVISKLIDARIKKGITQKELAKRVGTKQSAIARLETGNTNPSVDFLEKVISAMGYKLQIQIK